MSEKQKPTTTDYIVTALSPALIAALIDSLVFFLAELLYAGQYEGRLQWTLFFLIGGMVLVARISITIDQARAKAYGLALAGVCWASLLAFVHYPEGSGMSEFAGLINAFLILVIWWCSNKLTWDCTYIDEKRRASGKGLLAAAGIEKRPDLAGQARVEDERIEVVESDADARQSFSERWRRYSERRNKRPHTPGVTVIWFSLAALPIFGLGQSLIPAGDASRRVYVFWLAAAYVGSSLGLLLTTSFLGLRRYLRQRKLPMPRAITGLWLGLGTALVLLFLVVGALLPRPYSETPIWNLNRLVSADRQASKNAVLGNSPGKGQGAAGPQKQSDSGQPVKPGDGQSGSANGQSGDKSGGSTKGSGGKESGGQKGANGKQSGGKKQGAGKEGAQKKQGGDKKDGGGDAGEKSDNSSGEQEPEEKNDEQGGSKQEGSTAGNSGRTFPETGLGKLLESVAALFKWVVFIIVALVVVAFLVYAALKYFGNFSPWASNLLKAWSDWWRRLFEKKAAAVPVAAAAPSKPVRRPFRSYSNPFEVGDAAGRSDAELIEYSFSAFEAWAADRNHGRRADETPLEFASRLSNTFRSLEGHPHNLAVLVARLAYGGGALPREVRTTLELFWINLSSTMIASDAA